MAMRKVNEVDVLREVELNCLKAAAAGHKVRANAVAQPY